MNSFSASCFEQDLYKSKPPRSASWKLVVRSKGFDSSPASGLLDPSRQTNMQARQPADSKNMEITGNQLLAKLPWKATFHQKCRQGNLTCQQVEIVLMYSSNHHQAIFLQQTHSTKSLIQSHIHLVQRYAIIQTVSGTRTQCKHRVLDIANLQPDFAGVLERFFTQSTRG